MVQPGGRIQYTWRVRPSAGRKGVVARPASPGTVVRTPKSSHDVRNPGRGGTLATVTHCPKRLDTRLLIAGFHKVANKKPHMVRQFGMHAVRFFG